MKNKAVVEVKQTSAKTWGVFSGDQKIGKFQGKNAALRATDYAADIEQEQFWNDVKAEHELQRKLEQRDKDYLGCLEILEQYKAQRNELLNDFSNLQHDYAIVSAERNEFRAALVEILASEAMITTEKVALRAHAKNLQIAHDAIEKAEVAQ